ncbi:MAG: DUF2267 domain-containing protein [Chloroflexi bacterium]|nr:DUF2267 domain-containing protein [Chloroflexota bacterium]
MEYHQFLGQVQHRARLADFEDAVTATRATLQTLGERLFGGEAGNLAAQLPKEIGHYLLEATKSESFGFDEFIDRVCIREGVERPKATFHARVVMELVREAVSPSLLAKVRAQLPADYNALFAATGVGTRESPPQDLL